VAAETVTPGSMHVWEIVNQPNPMGMAMAHPIHLHGPQFRVLSRTGASKNPLRERINDAGWIDTVLVLPGETVRAEITFSKHPGLYLYHCHILEARGQGYAGKLSGPVRPTRRDSSALDRSARRSRRPWLHYELLKPSRLSKIQKPANQRTAASCIILTIVSSTSCATDCSCGSLNMARSVDGFSVARTVLPFSS
jgi:Multicopper oxidase